MLERNKFQKEVQIYIKYYIIGIILQLLIQKCGGIQFDEKILCNIDEYQIDLYKCKNCHEQCQSCIGPTSTDCLQCKNVMYNGKCVDICPDDYFKDDNDNCKKCNILHCEKCEDIVKCLKCNDQFELSINHDYCVYKKKDLYAYIDEKNKNQIKSDRSCPDDYATNEQGRYCQSIPFCLEENQIIELEEKCFDKGSKDSKGIRMEAVKQNVIFYKERQAKVYSIKDYNDEILKIVFYKDHLYVIYPMHIDLIDHKLFQTERKINLDENILNTIKSFIFSFDQYDQLFLTTSINNDTWFVINLSNQSILGDQHIGEQILDIRFEDKKKVFIVVTFTKIQIIFMIKNEQNVYEHKIHELATKWGYGIQNVYTLFYYPQNDPQFSFALFFDEYNLIIIDLQKLISRDYFLKDIYSSAYIIQQLGYIALFQINKILLYKLEGLNISNLNEPYQLSVKGYDFLIVFSSPYFYISSQDVIQSFLYVYDVNFEVKQNIPLTQGKITSLFLMKPNAFNSLESETIIACKDDNVFDIQQLKIKRYLLDNCYDQQEKLFDQSVTFLNGYVKDKYNGIEFYVSVNVYGRLVFILLKNNQVFKYKEIFDSRLQNISSPDILPIYINEIERKIKIIGIQQNLKKLIVIFSYYQLQILSIKIYSQFIHQNEKLIIANLDDVNGTKVYFKNTFSDNDDSDRTIYDNQKPIYQTVYDKMYLVVVFKHLDDDEIKTLYYQIVLINLKDYKILENETHFESVEYLTIISSKQFIVFTSQQFIIYNLIDFSLAQSNKHFFNQSIKDVQFIINQNLLIVFSQVRSNSQSYFNSFHIIDIDTFKTKQILKPQKPLYVGYSEFTERNTEIVLLNSDYTNTDLKNLLIVTSISNYQFILFLIYHPQIVIKIKT